ncbi:FAD-binding domain-containing protein [Methylotenera sp.]|uniref:FAD-binding domain-containing protein n=1 Tax=Methylotenera sp. TaxID=2051956 RepID=UPI00273419DB|nr:FAD-binding domain-containing protein [Methylotenera sp.]MDP3212092.1 FAD-binding domain-containing protein [Methylotenera sp.]
MSSAQKLNIPSDRVERLHYIRRIFSAAKGPDLEVEWSGGRASGVRKLNAIDAIQYGRNRNFINGAVTHLSPYLRHGCLTLNEVFAFVKKQSGIQAEKLLMELAWRDFWRQVWFTEGNAIFSEMEPPKVDIQYQPLSDSVKQANTGLPCMDGFVRELLDTGYLHNHARMWFASYVVHHLKMDWREAADWFEAHLLDGDFASNHLSWQWIASTFSSKPYYFNKENLERYTGGKYCATCSAQCPFDASYEALNARLFTPSIATNPKQYTIKSLPMKAAHRFQANAIYIHDEMLSAHNALMDKPYPKIFVFDPVLYGNWSLNRLQFVADCLHEMMSVEVWMGDTHEVFMQKGVGQVVTQDTPNLTVKEILAPFAPRWQPMEKLVNVRLSENRLKRFSRYWEKVSPLLMPDI